VIQLVHTLLAVAMIAAMVGAAGITLITWAAWPRLTRDDRHPAAWFLAVIWSALALTLFAVLTP